MNKTDCQPMESVVKRQSVDARVPFTLKYALRSAEVAGLKALASTELSAAAASALRASDRAPRTVFARTLPSSTPHWSKELMPQIAPCTAVRCSKRARICPVVRASSLEKSSEDDGRLPGKTLCGRRAAGTSSATSSSSVLPMARASGCAKKLDI